MKLIARLLMASVLLLMVAAPVSAKPSKTLTIVESPDCTFTLNYTWNGMGGRSDLTVRLALIGWHANGSSVLGWSGTSPVSAKSGSYSHAFASTEAFAYQYQGYAYLQTAGRVIARSEVSTELTSAKSCSAI